MCSQDNAESLCKLMSFMRLTFMFYQNTTYICFMKPLQPFKPICNQTRKHINEDLFICSNFLKWNIYFHQLNKGVLVSICRCFLILLYI